MYIVKLVLHNYKRVFLNNITTITYTPKAMMQIVLGQNGSGKSSLLEQLTPLPANLKKDFGDDGYKEIHISHNNQTYLLKSSDGNKHSFILDGNELNDGHTVRVQNKLVEYYFGITNHIQQLLLGKNQLTTMSPSERKRWITEISSIDYTYPITVYNNLKQRHRDLVGGIKLLQANIVRVKESSLPTDLIESLLCDKKHLSIIIEHLLTLRTNVVVEDTITDKMDNVGKLVKSISKINKVHIPETIAELDKLSKELKFKIEVIDIQVRALYKQLNELTTVDVVIDKDKLTDSLLIVDNKISTILSKSKLSGIEDIKHVYEYISSNYTDIVSMLSTLNEYTGIDTSKENMGKLTNTKLRLENSIQNSERSLYKTEERLDHLDHHRKEGKDIECPKCKYLWTPDNSLSERQHYVETIDRLSTEIASYKLELATIVSEIGNITNILHVVNSFVKMLSYNEDSKRLLTYVKEHPNYISNGHSSLFSVFEDLYRELNELYPVIQLKLDKSDIEVKLLDVSKHTAVKQDVLNTTKDSLLLHIDGNKLRMSGLVKQLDVVNNNIVLKKRYLTNLETLHTGVKDLYSTKKLVLLTKRNNLLKSGINSLRETLLDIDTKLNKHTEYETMLTTYQNELDILNTKERLLKLTLKELSPSEGLIAKSISSFLNRFIQDMNSIISTIWGYDMEILSCDLADNDLDYKFKVLVNNEEIIEDIGKTSSSMQEIINLVFKIIFSKYKGFIDYPLILDEVGKTFDTNHRINMYESLERHIANDFSQIYMVSHFESMYGRFGTADISILGTSGVDMNTVDNYNEVMTLV